MPYSISMGKRNNPAQPAPSHRNLLIPNYHRVYTPAKPTNQTDRPSQIYDKRQNNKRNISQQPEHFSNSHIFNCSFFHPPSLSFIFIFFASFHFIEYRTLYEHCPLLVQARARRCRFFQTRPRHARRVFGTCFSFFCLSLAGRETAQRRGNSAVLEGIVSELW